MTLEQNWNSQHLRTTNTTGNVCATCPPCSNTWFPTIADNDVSLLIIIVRDGWRYQNGWIFGKLPKGEGGTSQSKNMLQILDLFNRFLRFVFQSTFPDKLQYDIPKMRGREGGGQRLFGTFPKIHPFWLRHRSLSHGIYHAKVYFYKQGILLGNFFRIHKCWSWRVLWFLW